MVMDYVKLSQYEKVDAKIEEKTEGTYTNEKGKEVKGDYIEISYEYKDKIYSSKLGIDKTLKENFKKGDTQTIYLDKENPEKYVCSSSISFIGLAIQVIITICVGVRYYILNKKLKKLNC